jgi:hypothetical protein
MTNFDWTRPERKMAIENDGTIILNFRQWNMKQETREKDTQREEKRKAKANEKKS